MSQNRGPLDEYSSKRQFDKTPEPRPEIPVARLGPLMFSIQLHSATRLHWDLRLELDGVLRSWAIPKGPSYDPAEKRFAVQTEDHPFEYGSFEGVIPKDEYGGGEVVVWDCGSYWCDEYDSYPSLDRAEAQAAVRDQLDAGKLSLFFRGTKLKGSWALVRMKEDQGWLFFKHADGYERSEEIGDQTSVLTGFSLEDVKRQMPFPSRYRAGELGPHGVPEELPTTFQPMLATLSDTVFDHSDWIYEPKLDGIRAIVTIHRDEIKILTRKGLDFTPQFPELARWLRKQRAASMVLDGEIVAFGPDGKASFHSMQQRLNLSGETALAQADQEYPAAFYAFDILHADGFNLRSLPLRERKRLLRQCLLPDDRVKETSWLVREGRTLFSAALASGLEGVVAKRADSRYEPGKRSKYWLKVKGTLSSEFVVGGFSEGEGARKETFGALLVGHWVDGRLQYASHVGSGFDEATLERLRSELMALEVSECPFAEEPPVNSATHWVKPEMVVEVKYAEVTPLGNLRAPVFVGVRTDVDAAHATMLVPAVPYEIEAANRGSVESELAASVVDQLESAKSNVVLRIGQHELPVTNLGKVLWPASESEPPATKRDFLKYLALVSSHMLRHLADRPLTMIRFPEGIFGEKFFQKHWEQRKPNFVETVRLYSESNDQDQDYVVANNLSTLLWLGQLGTLEFHVPAARAVAGPDGLDLGTVFTGSPEAIESSLLNYPDFIEFDIDPYRYSGHEAPGDEPELHKEGFELGKSAAYWLRSLVGSLGLTCFVKTTGKTGLHVFAPIQRNLDFDAVRALCETLCRSLEREHPKELTTEWSIPKRTGKAFLDYNMNVRMKTLGCAYSPRALPSQAISMPLTWEELKDAYPNQFTLRSAPGFLEGRGDAWSEILGAKIDLTGI